MFVRRSKYNELLDRFDILSTEYKERCSQLCELSDVVKGYEKLLDEIRQIVAYYKDPNNKCKKSRFVKTIENKCNNNGLQ